MSGHPETEYLTALREGWLTASEAARLEAHLAECAACRRTFRDLDLIVEHLRTSAGEVDPPPGGYEALLEATLALREKIEPIRLPAVRRWFTPAIVAAAALIITLTTVFLLDRSASVQAPAEVTTAETDLPDAMLEEHALASDAVPFSTGVTLLVSAGNSRW